MEALIRGINDDEARMWYEAHCTGQDIEFCFEYARTYGDPSITIGELEQLSAAFEERYDSLEEED
jgi:hypothetical protein